MAAAKIIVDRQLGFGQRTHQVFLGLGIDEAMVVSREAAADPALQAVLKKSWPDHFIVRFLAPKQFAAVYKARDWYGKKTGIIFGGIDDLFSTVIDYNVPLPPIDDSGLAEVPDDDTRRQWLAMRKVVSRRGKR